MKAVGREGRTGWLGFARSLAVDVLVVALLAVAISLVVVIVFPSLVGAEWSSATFTLRSGEVVVASTPEDVVALREKYRGQIREVTFNQDSTKIPEGAMLLAMMLPLSLMIYTGIRDRARLRHWFSPRLEDPLHGIAAGVGLYLLQFALFYTAIEAGLVSTENVARPTAGPISIVVALVFAPLGEELFFRGRLQQIVFEQLGRRWSWGVPAALFALLHPTGSGWMLALAVGYIFAVGLVLAWLRQRSGRLVSPVICHAVLNACVLAGFLNRFIRG